MDGVTADEYEQDLEGNLQTPAGPREVRHVPGAAGATCAYSERRLDHRDPPDRNSHAGGQNSPACGGHAAGADLRAGLSGLLVRFPTRPICTRSIGLVSRPDDERKTQRRLGASVVSHADGILFRAARARATFSRMSSAFFVQTKVLGLAL